ncbi:MprA protease, GlyGly-CTERM protein-sorting domain-containing form [Ralstonia solanacearum]
MLAAGAFGFQRRKRA